MNRIDEQVVCPYYKRSGGDEIVCEGVTEDSRNRITFTQSAQKERCNARLNYLKTFCCGEYESCRWKQTLDKVYEQ